MSICCCVTDESECVPWDELFSLLVFSRLQFSLRVLFWQFLLRGPRLRTIIHDVFVSYLKNWQWSQIAPIIHISCFCNSCIFRASHDCVCVFASRSDSWHQALRSISLWQSYTCTWLHLVNSLSSNPEKLLLFYHNIGLKPVLWEKHAMCTMSLIIAMCTGICFDLYSVHVFYDMLRVKSH